MTKSSAARAARRELRRKTEMVPLKEISNRANVVFAPGTSPNGRTDCGWVEMNADPKGRDAIQRIFPKAHFGWRQCPYPWDGWQSFVPHVPSLAANCANTLPPDLVKLKPLQEANDNQLSFLMASAAKDQGVRSAWVTIDHKDRPSLNFLDRAFKRNPNVLNLPTVRPFDLSKPEEAFLYGMATKAEANLALNDGTTAPIKRIIANSDLVFAMWQDLSQPHGVGHLVIKGEDLLKKSEPVEVTADAFMVDCYEMALSAKQTLV